MSTLREEITNIIGDNYDPDSETMGVEQIKEGLVTLFKQQMLEIIGEDDLPDFVNVHGSYEYDQDRVSRNVLRAQLRQEVDKL